MIKTTIKLIGTLARSMIDFNESVSSTKSSLTSASNVRYASPSAAHFRRSTSFAGLHRKLYRRNSLFTYTVSLCLSKWKLWPMEMGQSRWRHHWGPQCKLWHAMILKSPYYVLVTYNAWGWAAACQLGAVELACNLYHFLCSESCSQSSKMLFILSFCWFTSDLFRWKKMDIIFAPNYTCKACLNLRQFLVFEQSHGERNQMHRHEGNAIPAGSYVGYFFHYITTGCRKNAEIYSGNFEKVAVKNLSLWHAATRERDRKVLHVCTTTFLLE